MYTDQLSPRLPQEIILKPEDKDVVSGRTVADLVANARMIKVPLIGIAAVVLSDRKIVYYDMSWFLKEANNKLRPVDKACIDPHSQQRINTVHYYVLPLINVRDEGLKFKPMHPHLIQYLSHLIMSKKPRTEKIFLDSFIESIDHTLRVEELERLAEVRRIVSDSIKPYCGEMAKLWHQ